MFAGYSGPCAAVLWRAAAGTVNMREETIMIDQEMEWPIAGRLGPAERKAQLTDVGLTIAAIIAITRREWMLHGRVSPALDEAAVDRPRFAHPLIRFALDAKRGNAWRARRSAGADAMPGADRGPGLHAEGCVLELDSE
jgi:hypothetical protein